MHAACMPCHACLPACLSPTPCHLSCLISLHVASSSQINACSTTTLHLGVEDRDRDRIKEKAAEHTRHFAGNFAPAAHVFHWGFPVFSYMPCLLLLPSTLILSSLIASTCMAVPCCHAALPCCTALHAHIFHLSHAVSLCYTHHPIHLISLCACVYLIPLVSLSQFCFST